MNRKVLIIRHAKSIGGRHNRHQFPPEGAPLSEQGFADAKSLEPKLRALGLSLGEVAVATSTLIRTRQTAESAGFKNLVEYKSLNEVNPGLEPDVLDEMVQNKLVPSAARKAAKELLRNPPKEDIWVTHGMLIAGIAEELGIPKAELYIPDMASITEVQIPE